MTRQSRLVIDGYHGYETRLSLVRFRESYAPITVSGPVDVFEFLEPVRDADRESLYSLLLDSRNQLVGCEEVCRGSLNAVRTMPGDVYKGALLSNACGLVLAHNHPSGGLDPSTEDVTFTRSMVKAGELLGVQLYDHVIVTDRGYTSLRERGLC